MELLNLILQPCDAKTHVVGDRYVSMNICKTMQQILQFTEMLEEGWIKMWQSKWQAEPEMVKKKW